MEKENFQTTKLRISELLKHIDKMQADIGSTPEHIYGLKKELRQAYVDEENYWKLKSQNQWLNAGDRNTKFFHACAKNRTARNHIVSIFNGQDEKKSF